MKCDEATSDHKVQRQFLELLRFGIIEFYKIKRCEPLL